jgi:hypothetical protein
MQAFSRMLASCRSSRWLVPALLSTVSVLLLAPLTQTAIAKGPNRAPDLAIRHANMGGKPFVFFGQATAGQISVSDTTENIGRRRAGPTVNAVYLSHEGHIYKLADRAVPALRPGQRDSGEDSIRHDVRAPLGDYRVVICANVKRQEREDRTNNCETVRKHFYVVARLWQGSLGGTWSPPGSASETWRSSGARLDFELYTGEGKVLYVFTGTVSWNDTGTAADGCAFSGSGSKSYTRDESIGSMTVDYQHETYDAELQATATGVYQITETCPHGGPVTVPGPLNLLFWAPSPPAGTAPLPFGSLSLPGSPAQEPFTVFTWNITAREPSE